MQEENNFVITSGFGVATQKPFVSITLGSEDFHIQMDLGSEDFHIQMDVEDAVKLAIDIIRVAEASLIDAYFIKFMREEVDIPDHQIANILAQFRKYRDGYE